MNPLSASRIKLAKQCSWQYWCRYVLKLPDKGNDGSSRGSIVHLVLELLATNKRRKLLKTIVKANSLYSYKPLSRLVLYHARKLNVADEENLALIDSMTLNGLNFDFIGDRLQKPHEALTEKHFDLSVEEGNLNYRVLGFIDKLFLYKDGTALIRDFKTSKQVFKGSDVDDNLQDLIYCLATKKLYPEIKNVKCEFLFLKFPLEVDMLGNLSKGVCSMEPISDDELEGFEHQLTQTQKYLDNFNDVAALSNMAAVKGYPKDGTFGGPLVCGREGFKKHKGENLLDNDGNPIPSYICPYRKPLDYYVILNSEGKIIKSAFEDEKHTLVPDESKGEVVELKSYAGCPHWNQKETDEFDL